MYSQEYIDSINETKLIDILNKRKSLPSATSKTIDDIRIYYVLQHYLVKKIIEKSDRKAAYELLEKYYEDFIKYPYLFVISPLIRNKNLDLLFGDKEFVKKIKEVRQKYFSTDDINTLIRKSQNNSLSEDEKNRYYALLIHNIRNPKFESIVSDEIDRIIDRCIEKDNKGNEIDIGIRNLSQMEINFYSQYITLFDNSRNLFIPAFSGEMEERTYGFHCGKMIFLNTKGKMAQSLALFTETICHETRHAIQVYDSKKESNKKAFETVQFGLFNKYTPEKNLSYLRNYRYSSIELDAEKLGHYNAGLFFYMRKRKGLYESVRQNRVDNYDKRNYYAYMIDSDNKRVPVDEFVVKNFDKIMTKHKEERNKYPVLQEYYDANGNRKSLLEFLIQRRTKYSPDNEMYDNFINYGIKNNELYTINLKRMDNDTKKDILYSLRNIYRSHTYNRLLAVSNDNPKDISPQQAVITTNYSINQAIRILDYVNANYDEFMTINGKNKIDNNNPIFDFIIDLRDHTLDKVQNPLLKGNERFISKYQELQSKVKELTDKFNKSYLNTRLDYLGKENLSRTIKLKDIGELTVEDYLYNYALPGMDSHQYVTFNGQKIYISDLLTSIKQHLDNENKKKDNK